LRSRTKTHQPLLPKVDTHGGDELVVKNIVRVLEEEAGLANAGVAQSKELQQIVVVHCHSLAAPCSQISPQHSQRNIISRQKLDLLKKIISREENKYAKN
jgi:hypothetical protein